MKVTTQQQDVLEWMQEHGSITTKQACYELGITRLSAYIFNLKRDGYNIAYRDKMVTTRKGRKTCVREYYLG